jgi:hypothetical protein
MHRRRSVERLLLILFAENRYTEEDEEMVKYNLWVKYDLRQKDVRGCHCCDLSFHYYMKSTSWM